MLHQFVEYEENRDRIEWHSGQRIGTTEVQTERRVDADRVGKPLGLVQRSTPNLYVGRKGKEDCLDTPHPYTYKIVDWDMFTWILSLSVHVPPILHLWSLFSCTIHHISTWSVDLLLCTCNPLGISFAWASDSNTTCLCVSLWIYTVLNIFPNKSLMSSAYTSTSTMSQSATLLNLSTEILHIVSQQLDGLSFIWLRRSCRDLREWILSPSHQQLIEAEATNSAARKTYTLVRID